MAARRAMIEIVSSKAGEQLVRSPSSIVTLRAATKQGPGGVQSLHLEKSGDLICKNLMCGKVGSPCICRVGRWVYQNREVLSGCKELSLRSNALHALPDEIFNLPQLTHLDLSDNDLSVVPEEISRLTALEVLYLNGNRHLASLPGSLHSLPNLRYVNVSDTGLCAQTLSSWQSQASSEIDDRPHSVEV
eukprot:INCI17901.2.p1 GENE.INCI17901.2~~INCI17901.2.p1  ORF type:complete len:189 (-),score=25.68 INCI17901.2:51-617(-)